MSRGHSIPRPPPGKERAGPSTPSISRLAVVTLDESDIVRHALVQQVVKAYEEGAGGDTASVK